MTEIYEFNVTISKENDVFSYAIYQVFTSGGSEEFEFIEDGEVNTLEEAAALAADGIRRQF